jgi:phenylalanyl-tRNA synthetase alpha chain
MTDQIDALSAEIDAATLGTDAEREAFRVRFLGRKSGAITDLFKGLRDADASERPALGQRLNALRAQAEERLAGAQSALDDAPERPAYDLTLPGRIPPLGSRHPLTQTLELIQDVFARMGFRIAEGPEIEDDFHNFTALGFPPDHPARDMQDTFFVARRDEGAKEDVVLRTHTSPVQVRALLPAAGGSANVPLRIIAPGRVYRNESLSFKSYCLFHQVEGLYVDEGVTFADLKSVLYRFAQAVFGADVQMRFRPSFFPFTEPSAEVDIWQAGADLPGGGRWLEILGCGMVDPEVFRHTGVDSERYTGYAFGMGVERIAMLRYGISDIRELYQNDVRLLAQF